MNPRPSRHISSEFDRHFAVLVEGVLRMADCGRKAYEAATKALLQGNTDLAVQAIGMDDEIDLLDKDLGREGLDMIMRFSPTADDLRRVVSCLRMLPDLERIGDECVSIAKRARRIAVGGPLPQVEMLREAVLLVRDLLGDALHAFDDMNGNFAALLPARDRAIDASLNDVMLSIAAIMESVPGEDTPRLVDLLLASRSLERIGDHAKNLAEEVVFATTGEDVRHELA